MPPDPDAGAAAHYRALESLYRHAPVNGLFESQLEIVEKGFARIRFEVREQSLRQALRTPGYVRVGEDDG